MTAQEEERIRARANREALSVVYDVRVGERFLYENKKGKIFEARILEYAENKQYLKIQNELGARWHYRLEWDRENNFITVLDEREEGVDKELHLAARAEMERILKEHGLAMTKREENTCPEL